MIEITVAGLALIAAAWLALYEILGRDK